MSRLEMKKGKPSVFGEPIDLADLKAPDVAETKKAVEAALKEDEIIKQRKAQKAKRIAERYCGC